MKKRFLKAAAMLFAAGALLVGSYGGLATVKAESIGTDGWVPCPEGIDSCDGGSTCPHGLREIYDPGFDDYGRRSQKELEELTGDEWHKELKGSRHFGSILVKTSNGETILAVLEATEEGMVLRAYYKGEEIAVTAVLTENPMVISDYTISLNNGDEKTVRLDSEPTGASGNINNILFIVLSGAGYEKLVINGDVLADFFAAIDAAM